MPKTGTRKVQGNIGVISYNISSHEDQTQVISSFNSSFITEAKEEDWLVDSGAGESMTSDFSKFVPATYEEYLPGQVTITGVGGTVDALGRGDVIETINLETIPKNASDGDQHPANILIKNVLYVPSLPHSLLSVSSFTSQNEWNALFVKGNVGFLRYTSGDESKSLLTYLIPSNGIYVLKVLPFSLKTPSVEEF
jgi:hypothetical protein